MACGIYKIENKINGHIYIGQSINITARWRRHREMKGEYTITKAFKKYGLENFEFSVIEECPREELNEREIYWIAYYNSYQDGYNETLGGSHSVPSKLDLSKIEEIEELLLTSNLTNTEIGERFGVSENTICAINTGKSWYRDGIDYPIRQTKQTLSRSETPESKNKLEALINKEQEGKEKNKVKSKKPSKEELLQLLKDNKGNFCEVGRIFEVSDNAVRKWCKSYNLPFHTSDYKEKVEKNHKFDGFKPVALVEVEEDKVIKTFETCAAAARWLKEVDDTITAQERNVATAIGRVCNGDRQTCYKRKWKFI